MAATGHEVHFAAEELFHIGALPVTNALLTTWCVMALLIVFSYFATKKLSAKPKTRLQSFAEMLVEGLWENVETIAGPRAKIFFPILATLFIYIITANYFGLLPIVSGFGLVHHIGKEEVIVPIFRSINSDLNTTLALSLFSVAATHYFAIKFLGLADYLRRFFSLNPIYLFVGVLELVSELTKIVSLSFRLFGNIFAGETLLSTVSNLAAFVVPLPFMFLELLVGFVQATVFMMLTLVFMVILTEKHEAH